MLSAIIIGNRIAEARKKMNLSQAELAQRLFISSQAVGKWERGGSMPDIITLNRLAEILGVDLNYFSGNSGHVTQAEVSENISGESLSAETNIPAGKTGRKMTWDMSRGNWVDADFSGLKNLHEKFSSSNMQRCKFIDSDLSGILLKNNNVDSCDFSGSSIISSHIQGSNLANNTFKDCSLKETEFMGSHVTGCDFSGADFTGVVLKSGGFDKNKLSGSEWNRTSFIETYIADCVFEGKVDDCYFENSAFKRVTFQNAVLTNTFFKNRSLKGIRFVDCKADKMTYEFLKNGKADLSGITLLDF